MTAAEWVAVLVVAAFVSPFIAEWYDRRARKHGWPR